MNNASCDLLALIILPERLGLAPQAPQALHVLNTTQSKQPRHTVMLRKSHVERLLQVTRESLIQKACVRLTPKNAINSVSTLRGDSVVVKRAVKLMPTTIPHSKHDILKECKDKKNCQVHVFDKRHPPVFYEGYDIIMAWCYGNPDYDKKRVTAAEVQATKMLKAKVTAREADDQIAKMRNMLKEDLYPMLKTGWYMAEETSDSPFEGRVNDLPVTLKYKHETNVLGHIEKKTINTETGELQGAMRYIWPGQYIQEETYKDGKNHGFSISIQADFFCVSFYKEGKELASLAFNSEFTETTSDGNRKLLLQAIQPSDFKSDIKPTVGRKKNSD